LRTLSEILHEAPYTKVIVITGNDDRGVAVQAVGQGAFDFYEKPIDADVLQLIVARALRMYELEAENRALTQVPSTPIAGLIVGCQVMLAVCSLVEKIAPTQASVLILGESGTGKEIIARALHNLSLRQNEKFIAINCAAIPETLLESELFGYEKGAFTGANRTTKGKLEYADGGTLFLDEMGDLPLSLQAKLLRFLQERVIERLGGREEIAVDVRVVCATHKDLKKLILSKLFREDLYYRISELSVEIPPLREREGEAVLIARALLERHRQPNGLLGRQFSPTALMAIDRHPWPGNVRELENRVKRAVIMAESTLIEPRDLELESALTGARQTLREVRASAELKAIEAAIFEYQGRLGKVADALGVSRPTLYTLLRKHNLAAELEID
jgi:two-component system NtrC family response regulator